MSKELEAFDLVKRTCELFIKSTSHLIGSDIITNQINEALDTIKQALTELNQIKGTEPSDALNCVGVLKEEGCITTLVQGKILETIRQYILKAQEQEKVLKVIKNIIKFGDDLNSILGFDTYEEYCEHSRDYNYELTKEEFDSLKKGDKQ